MHHEDDFKQPHGRIPGFQATTKRSSMTDWRPGSRGTETTFTPNLVLGGLCHPLLLSVDLVETNHIRADLELPVVYSLIIATNREGDWRQGEVCSGGQTVQEFVIRGRYDAYGNWSQIGQHNGASWVASD